MTVLGSYTFEPPNVTLSGLTVTAAADQSGNGFNLANAGAPQYEQISWNGYPAVLFDGVDDTLKQTTGLANAFVGGIDKACYMILAIQATKVDASGACFVGVGDNASANPFYRLVRGTGNPWGARKRDAATGAGAGAGGESAVLIDGRPHIVSVTHTGTAFTLKVDSVTIASGAMDVGDMGTLDTLAIGCLSRNTDGSFASMRLWAASFHDTVTAGEEAALESLFDKYMGGGGMGGGDHFRRRI